MGITHHTIAPIATCVTYKLLERVLLQRITVQIDEAIPVEQAAFQSGRGCCEQFLSLTSHIEYGFDKRYRTGRVFIDLKAALIRKHGLVHKLTNIIPCSKVASRTKQPHAHCETQQERKQGASVEQWPAARPCSGTSSVYHLYQ